MAGNIPRGYFLGGNFLEGKFSSGEVDWWELSGWEISGEGGGGFPWYLDKKIVFFNKTLQDMLLQIANTIVSL